MSAAAAFSPNQRDADRLREVVEANRDPSWRGEPTRNPMVWFQQLVTSGNLAKTRTMKDGTTKTALSHTTVLAVAGVLQATADWNGRDGNIPGRVRTGWQAVRDMAQVKESRRVLAHLVDLGWLVQLHPPGQGRNATYLLSTPVPAQEPTTRQLALTGDRSCVSGHTPGAAPEDPSCVSGPTPPPPSGVSRHTPDVGVCVPASRRVGPDTPIPAGPPRDTPPLPNPPSSSVPARPVPTAHTPPAAPTTAEEDDDAMISTPTQAQLVGMLTAVGQGPAADDTSGADAAALLGDTAPARHLSAVPDRPDGPDGVSLGGQVIDGLLAHLGQDAAVASHPKLVDAAWRAALEAAVQAHGGVVSCLTRLRAVANPPTHSPAGYVRAVIDDQVVATGDEVAAARERRDARAAAAAADDAADAARDRRFAAAQTAFADASEAQRQRWCETVAADVPSTVASRRRLLHAEVVSRLAEGRL